MANILIHEASNPEDTGNFRKGHITPSLLGKLAKEANVKKLVLTHMYPICNGREKEMAKDVKKEFKGKIVKGKDFLKIKL